MITQYRVVHVAPDPCSGLRLPIGAVMTTATGNLTTLALKHLPSAEVLGSESLAHLVNYVASQLHTVRSIDAISMDFGPYVLVDEPRAIPLGVADASAWLSSQLDRTPKDGPHLRRTQGPRRASQGFAFFRTWGVADQVKRTFEPKKDGCGWLRDGGRGLPRVSHWVEGAGGLLLMEPVVPSRQTFKLEVDEVVSSFLMYRAALTLSGRDDVALIAYITAGGSHGDRGFAAEVLGQYGAVVDTDSDAQRQALLRQIQDTAASGNLAFQ